MLFEWVAEANRRLDAGEGVGSGRLREMLHAFGLERLVDDADDEAPEEVQAAGGAARGGPRRSATSPRRTGCGTSWRSAAGRFATPRTAPGSCAAE